MEYPFRAFWSTSLVVIFISWNLSGTHCKPLQQQSNDRLLIDSDRLPITNVYDLDTIEEVTLSDQSQSESDIRLEKLTRTMNALAQFRRVINNRLLTTNALAQSEDTSDEGLDTQRRSFLVTAEDERTSMKVPSPRKPHRNHHRRKPHDRTSAVTPRPFQREHREDPELQSNTYRVHGFNIKAHLQPETPVRDTGQPQGDEQGQRFMTGRTTTMDDQQLRLLPELPQPDFGEFFYAFGLMVQFRRLRWRIEESELIDFDTAFFHVRTFHAKRTSF